VYDDTLSNCYCLLQMLCVIFMCVRLSLLFLLEGFYNILHMKRQRCGNDVDDEPPNTKHIKLNETQPSNNRIASDCLFHIFEYCSADMIAFIVPAVCTTWKQIVDNGQYEQLLWRQLCFNHWPILVECDKQVLFPIQWKEFYKHHGVLISPLYSKGLFDVFVTH
jgi:hypothetical protein